ncbi:MAG: hypothetical protein E7108_01835 [Bacteroidales bacterium]|nr:hypothetical protein [Bacteroidales bacterium]
MATLKISDRTFGLELELADVYRERVTMPPGFKWDDLEIVQNTDMSEGRKKVPIGGELNSPPMKLCSESFRTIGKFLSSAKENGAKAIRDVSLQVHIYIGDLDLEEVKRIFYLCYFHSATLKELCHLPEYCDMQIYRPSPPLDTYLAVRSAKSFVALRTAFENNSVKGYNRYMVNVASYFKRKTVEFRLFNSTTDIEELCGCVMFCYRFVDLAIGITEEEIKSLTKTEFIDLLHASYKFPTLPPPLIYYADIESQNKDIFIHPRIDISNKFVSILLGNGFSDTLSFVNPHLFKLEARFLDRKKVRIYNNDELNHIIYLMATAGLEIHYCKDATFIEACNASDSASQIASVLMFSKVKGFFKDDEYAINELTAIKEKYAESFQGARKVAERLVSLLQNCDYCLGTLNDALRDGGDVFFQFESYSQTHTIIKNLKIYSDYKLDFCEKTTDYYNVVETVPEGGSLTLVSLNEYLPMRKIAVDGYKIMYSTKESVGNSLSKDYRGEFYQSYLEAPDSLRIDDGAKLSIRKVMPSEFVNYQRKYIKKVRKVMMCRFSYLVFYEDYLLGGFGFDYSKDVKYDIWLLSDFCTNNRIPRLSKLILLCVKSELVHKSISYANSCAIETCYTKVYTHQPVSMKYRALFDKKDKYKTDKFEDYLLYTTTLGTEGGYEDIIKKYSKMLKNGGYNSTGR